jgi:prepilin-type N-terminal cleavage/methylation domain-containing protein/prepilin-type processing-associated H-X9-DG protein
MNEKGISSQMNRYETRRAKRQTKWQTKRRAFTLIEILVVIAIIGILAAILFPVFARARENARRSSCQSNLKQLALGVHQYTQDYDERFPIGLWVDSSSGTDDYQTALENVFPYFKNEQISICPSDSEPLDVDLGLPGTTPASYTVNDWLFTPMALGAPAPPSLAEVRSPSRLPMNWDGKNVSTNPAAPDIQVARRHFEGADCAFVDGHVKWIKTRPELSDPDGPPEADIYWNAPPDSE